MAGAVQTIDEFLSGKQPKPLSIDAFLDSTPSGEQSVDEFLGVEKETVIAQAEFPKRVFPWWKRGLSLALGSHVELPETDRPGEPEEVSFTDEGEIIKPEIETAELGFLEDPTGLALAGAAFPAAKGAAAGLSWGKRVVRAFVDYAGWLTGGVTDVPRLSVAAAKGTVKGAEKVTRGVGAKRLEESLAPAVKTAERGLGVAPVKAAAEVPTGAVAGAAKIAERETEQIRQQFKERFVEAVKQVEAPKPKELALPTTRGITKKPAPAKLVKPETVDVTKQPGKLIRTEPTGRERLLAELRPDVKEKPFTIPDELKTTFEHMKEQVSRGQVERAEKGFIIQSTFPDWFKGRGWSKKGFDAVMNKLEAGKILTPTQDKMFEQLKITAGKLRTIEPELIAEQDIAAIVKKGFEPVVDDVLVGDLKQGDEFLIKGERFKLKRFDKEGNAIIEDGTTIKADVFETLKIDAIKRKKPLPKPVADPGSVTTLYGGLPIDPAALGKTWTKIGTAAWDTMTMNKLPEFIKNVPFVGPPTEKAFGVLKEALPIKIIKRAMIREYRGDLPDTAKFIASIDDLKRGQAIGREYAIDLGTRLQAFPEEAQLRMGQYITGEKVALSKHEQSVADEAKRSMLDLGRQAVDVGLLSEETFFKNAGQYMPRLYTSKEYQGLLTNFRIKKPNRLDLQRFKKRKDIPKEIREEMGEILKPGFPIAKGITQLTHDVEMSRFFTGIAQNPEWALSKQAIKEGAAIPEGWKLLGGKTKLKKLGALDGAYVHPEIFGDMEHVAHLASKGERTWNKALGAWKFGKVILSPKTHMRNLMSNSILAHLGGMPMPVQPVFLARAAKEMRNKGKIWQEVRELGGLDHTWTSGELKSLFDEIPGAIAGTETMAESVGKIGAMWEITKKAGRKAADLYEAEEQIFKIAKYMHSRGKGATPKEAWADAEKWLFNYSKLTKFQEKYRQKWYGAPFATFTFKSLPRVAEAWVKTPWRFALPGAMILGLEEAARREIGDTRIIAKAKRALLPKWLQGSTFGLPNFVRMPFMRDADGREYYLNLTYILPWGDIGESGKFGFIPGGIRPFSQPFLWTTAEQIMNYQKFFERQIVPDEDLAGKPLGGPVDILKGLVGRGGGTRVGTQTQKRASHLVRALAPTPVIDVTKAIDALRKRPTRGKFKAPKAVALDVLAGVKMYPVDYDDQVARAVAEKDPKKGFMAKKIMSRIRSLVRDKQAAAKVGGDTTFYDKQIKERIKQLEGLGRELKEVGKQAKLVRRQQ